VDELLTFAQKNQINVLLVQVRARNSAYYYVGGPKAPVFDALGALLSKKPAGLRVQAWIDGGWNYADYPPNYGDPAFRDYFKQWYIQPLLNYIGLDGIHLDRMRGATRHKECLTKLVNDIAGIVHAHGIQLTVAVTPTQNASQDWPSWDVDAVVPMNYTTAFLTYASWVNGQIVRANGQELWSGLPAYLPEADLEAMQDYADKAGLGGVAVYNYASLKSGRRTLPPAP
jgi:hypothetical protein